jgi:Zn-dependent protease with chaperone function
MDFATILYLLVPLVFLYLHDAEAVSDAREAGVRLAVAMAVSLLVGLAGQAVLRWRLRRFQREQAGPSRPAARIGRWTHIVSIFLVAGYVAGIQLFKLEGAFARLLFPDDWFLVSDLLLMLPFLLPFVWVKAEAQRLVLEARGVRSGIARQLRTTARTMAVMMAPQFLYLNVFRLVATDVPVVSDWFDSHPMGAFLLAGTLLVVLFLVSPYVMRLLFSRVPLAEHPAGRRVLPAIEELSRRTGVRFARLHVWLTQERRIPNAAVSGILSRQVNVFITDYLLESLSPGEIVAVVAHEVGHVRFRHLLFNLLLAVMTGVFVVWGYVLVAPYIDTQEQTGFAVVGLQLLYLAGIFGAFSRRFERQADLFAAHAVSNPHELSAALLSLARLAGISVSRSSITHPSIRDRVHSLARTYRKNGGDLRRALRRAWIGNLAWAAALLALLVTTAWMFD